MPSTSDQIAFFVSPHGFGHAARASAVISALYDRMPKLAVNLYSRTPPWFFRDSLRGPYVYHELLTDIGLVQENPMVEDLEATVEKLEGFLRFDTGLIDRLARQLNRDGCRLIVCDISPLGIVVANRAGIPSVLIENFTWDWIYGGYPDYREQFDGHIQHLQQIFSSATWRIQTAPNCDEQDADLKTGPICRKPRASKEEIRQQLKVPDAGKLVLITMGGIPDACSSLEQLRPFTDCRFLVPGDNEQLTVDGNLTLLPYHSGFYHPDLVNAADVVIGKVGYSTLAEVYHAGTPFGYFTRPDFRESDVLSAFVHKNMPGVHLSGDTYKDGSWIDHLPKLLEMSRVERNEVNGADVVSDFLQDLLLRRREAWG